MVSVNCYAFGNTGFNKSMPVKFWSFQMSLKLPCMPYIFIIGLLVGLETLQNTQANKIHNIVP
jgi:hypothetical protein